MKPIKILCFTIFAVLFAFLGVKETRASGIQTVRIGLESMFLNVSGLNFGDRQLSIGYEISGSFNNILTLNAGSRFSVALPEGAYFKSAESFTDYNAALSVANTYVNRGFKAYVCLSYPGIWNVAFASSDSPIPVSPIDAGRIVALYDGTIQAVIFDGMGGYPQFQNPLGFTSLGSRKYRGRIECRRSASPRLTAVNILPTEEYLYGVVPSEMPQAWAVEALKAQAVAARTYIYSRVGAHGSYDLCDTVHCQVYLGAGVNEAISTTIAVESTKGIIATYNNRPITASFFASSGGHTEDSEKVWIEALPYLRARPDTFETEYKEWSRTYTMQELSAAAAAKNADIGLATGISIAEISPYGRVQKLVIQGSKSSLTLTKEEIRTFFSSLTGGSLESRNFEIISGSVAQSAANIYVYDGRNTLPVPGGSLSVLNPNNSISLLTGGSVSVISASGTSNLPLSGYAVTTGNTVSIVGKGHGHGVGMSQYGAKGMAEAGFTFDQILKFYYSGIDIETR